MHQALARSDRRTPHRIPPLKEGTFLVFQRGNARFCVRCGDVKRVVYLDKLLVENGLSLPSGAFLDDLPLTAMDVAFVLGATPQPAGAETVLVELETRPASYVAADAIITPRVSGRPVAEGDLDDLISDLVIIDNDSVPLIDIWGVCFWIQSRDLRREIEAVVPMSEPMEFRDDNESLSLMELGRGVIEQFDQLEPHLDRRRLYDVCVVGGLGHVGLPLGISLADAGLDVALYDINEDSLRAVSSGRMPFMEAGAEPVLQRTLNRKLTVTANKHVIAESYYIVVVIGTPVDEHLNPQFSVFKRFLDDILECIHDDQHIVLRSTVYPGTTEKVKRYLEERGLKTRVSFCPERIVQGQALEELQNLPQLVASFDAESVQEAKELFLNVSPEVLELSPMEAELGKLFANVWRYVNFAVSNQFYEISARHGLDYHRIHEVITNHYPRLRGLCKPGFSAGPCLFKDTMQLAAFSNNSFFIGHAAMLVNEGLPNFIVQTLKEKYPLDELTVGLLGMTFKPDNDDKRSSLSYKLKKILDMEAAMVLCSDVYIQEEGFVAAEELVKRADVVIVATPHREYADIEIDTGKILVDVWNFYGKGGLF